MSDPLTYPKTENVAGDKNIEFTSDDGVTVRIKFIDLFNIKNLFDLLSLNTHTERIERDNVII